VLGSPEQALTEAQGVDDVADQHNVLGIDSLEKLRQLPYPRMLVAEMDIRQKQRANLTGRRRKEPVVIRQGSSNGMSSR